MMINDHQKKSYDRSNNPKKIELEPSNLNSNLSQLSYKFFFSVFSVTGFPRTKTRGDTGETLVCGWILIENPGDTRLGRLEMAHVQRVTLPVDSPVFFG